VEACQEGLLHGRLGREREVGVRREVYHAIGDRGQLSQLVARAPAIEDRGENAVESTALLGHVVPNADVAFAKMIDRELKKLALAVSVTLVEHAVP
jgi:hypothetical protein